MKITKNDIKKMFTKIYRVGYCEYYYELRKLKKIGYNSGVYGWNYDCYMLDYDTCILTGYRCNIGEPITDEIVDRLNELKED